MLKIDLGHLRRFTSWNVLAVNNTWALVPWAQAMYAGDRQWWNAYGHEVTFHGERWTSDPMAAQRYGLRVANRTKGIGLCRVPWRLHAGGNSGYQAINLAYHFGARHIVLLGFDMHRGNGAHWHGDHVGMLSAPDQHIQQWREMMVPLARDLKHAGVDVVNATPGTALEAFPCQPLFKALR